MSSVLGHRSLVLLSFLLIWIPAFSWSYGYFIDEFYYIACSKRLAFGYVDHPPLSIFFLTLIRSLFGDELFVLRSFPAACAAATVLVTTRTAQRLGANEQGQLLAAVAVIACPIYQGIFSFYSMNAISLLMWSLAFAVLVEIERCRDPKRWLVFGLIAGLALLNKHTFVLMGFGLAVGLLATEARRHFRDRYLWLGLGIAIVLMERVYQQAEKAGCRYIVTNASRPGERLYRRTGYSVTNEMSGWWIRGEHLHARIDRTEIAFQEALGRGKRSALHIPRRSTRHTEPNIAGVTPLDISVEIARSSQKLSSRPERIRTAATVTDR